MQPIQPSYVSAVQQMRAYRILRARVHQVLEPYGINASQWAIFGMLYQSPEGIRPTDLAAQLDVSTPMVTVLLQSLQEQGWISQESRDLDKRSKLVALSASGRSLVDTIEASLQKMGEKLFASISREEMAAYHKVLQAIIDSSEEL